jgi:hypothetical protein
MRWLAVLAGVLLIAGCDPGDPFYRQHAVYGQTDADTLRGECERAAYSDPEVKDAVATRAGTTANWGLLNVVDDKVRASVQRCMLAKGGTGMGGGVELPKR